MCTIYVISMHEYLRFTHITFFVHYQCKNICLIEYMDKCIQSLNSPLHIIKQIHVNKTATISQLRVIIIIVMKNDIVTTKRPTEANKNKCHSITDLTLPRNLYFNYLISLPFERL